MEFRRIGFLVLMLAATACSKGGDTPNSSTSNAVGEGFKAVDTALKTAGGLISNTAPSFVEATAPNSVGILSGTARNEGLKTGSNIWDGTGWMSDPRCSGQAGDAHCSTGAVNLKYYMGFMFDPNLNRDNGSAINVFGRVKQAMTVGCAMATVLGGGTGLPAAGTYTLAFNSSLRATLMTYCGFTATDLDRMSDRSVSVVVVNTSDTTTYDRKITIDGSQTMYMRVNDSTLNYLSAESDSTNFSRTVLSLNRTTGKLLAEYASVSSSGNGSGEWHRVFVDPPNATASMTGSNYDWSSSPNRLLFAVRGIPSSSSTDVAYSVGVMGFGLTAVYAGSSDTALNYFKSCVRQSTGASTTDNSITCGTVVGHDVSSGSGLASVFSAYLTAVGNNGSAGAKLVSASVVSETTAVPFTNQTNIYTTTVPVAP